MNYTDKEIIEIREIEYYLNNLEKIKEELRIASDIFKRKPKINKKNKIKIVKGKTKNKIK
tara:strand:- start:108 stop:287 length:180 start_codon:yes stop_codon:yes gene_type:complete